MFGSYLWRSLRRREMQPFTKISSGDVSASRKIASCWCAGSEVEGGVRDVTLHDVSCFQCGDGMR